MATSHAKYSAFALDEDELREALQTMESDASMNTVSTYSANTTLYPDGRMSFADKHVAYIKAHPSMNPRDYLSNLRLMIKRR